MVRVMPLRCDLYPVWHLHTSTASNYKSILICRAEDYVMEGIVYVRMKYGHKKLMLRVVDKGRGLSWVVSRTPYHIVGNSRIVGGLDVDYPTQESEIISVDSRSLFVCKCQCIKAEDWGEGFADLQFLLLRWPQTAAASAQQAHT